MEIVPPDASAAEPIPPAAKPERIAARHCGIRLVIARQAPV
jgi:hypothetical protein